jgi:hypothetical protein
VPGLRTSQPTDPLAERKELLARIRSTGAQGGRIDPHRSIATLHLSTVEMMLAGLLGLGVLVAYLAGIGLVERLWSWIFRSISGPLGLGEGIAQRATSVASLAQIAMPTFVAQAGAPSRVGWWITLLVTVLVIGASFLLRGSWLPLGYALRFGSAIQVTALVFFAVAPGSFPYDLSSYVAGMMLIGAIFIGLVPVVLALTFYVIDVSWSRKILLTAMIVGHLLVMVPLQYALHAVIIRHASLIVLPLLFIMFGLLPEIMVLVAFYGWGMSWPSPRARGQRQ